jgi:hypothetical protein
MEKQGGEVWLLLIHDLGTRWGGGVVSVTPRPRFTPGKEPPVPIVQEAGWAPRASLDTGVRGKILFPSAGDRTSNARSCSP